MREKIPNSLPIQINVLLENSIVCQCLHRHLIMSTNNSFDSCFAGIKFCLESLILAQDERWRRA